MTVAYAPARSPARAVARATAGVSSGFSPAAFSNLAVWLDASDYSTLTFNSTTIVGWANKGNAGADNAAQATAARQPLYVASAINGLPALQGRHDGSNASSIEIADSAALDYSQWTSFTVLSRVTDSGAQEHVVGKYTTTGNQREQRGIIDSVDRWASVSSTNGTATAGINTTGAISVGSPLVGITYYDGVNQTVVVGMGTPASGSLGSVFNGTSTYSLFSRGAADSFAEPYFGYIGEHLFYTSLLSAEQRNVVINYLSSKWKL